MSAINTGSINANYPVPGINNSSQGFRDNFAAIKNNLDTAGSEISDLQNKAVLKSALTGTVLDNDMNNTLISNALTKGFRSTTINLGNDLSGYIDIDFKKADVHFGTITGDVNLKFINWPKSGTHAKMQLIFKIGVPNVSIIFPEMVDESRKTLENKIANDAQTVTVSVPSGVEILHYVISTENCGETLTVVPVNRPRKSTQLVDGDPITELREYSGVITSTLNEIDINGTNTLFGIELKVGKKIYNTDGDEIGVIKNIFSNTFLRLVEPAKIAVTDEVYKSQYFLGNIGDKLGAVYATTDAIAVCTKDYDGVSEIWEKISFNQSGLLAAVSSIKVSGGTTGLTFSPDREITTYGEFTMSGVLGAGNGGTGSDNLFGFVFAPGMGTQFISYEKVPGNMLSGEVPIINGGTGASERDAALKNLLPEIIGNFGEYLRTDGVNVFWDTVTLDLPIASDTVLGGFKVGEGLSINSTSGVMRLSPATTMAIGGVISDGVTTNVDSLGLLSVSATGLLNVTLGDNGKYLRTNGTDVFWSELVIPYASMESPGVVRVDGATTIIDPLTGVLSAIYVLPMSSPTVLGGVKVDGTSIEIDEDGVISVVTPQLVTASETVLGVVRIDNKTIVYNQDTQISVSREALLGLIDSTADQIIDSLPKATDNNYGVVQVDGITIQSTDGIISVAPTVGAVVGEIKMWPTNNPPAGYFLCNGANVLISAYPVLHSVLSSLYNTGTVPAGYFKLPNFTNRMPVGAGDLYNSGNIGGNKDAVVISHTHTVTIDTGGSHTHTGTASTAGTHNHGFRSGESTGTTGPEGGEGGTQYGPHLTDAAGDHTHSIVIDSGGGHNHTGSATTTGVPGTDQNMPPYLGVYYIIKHDY